MRTNKQRIEWVLAQLDCTLEELDACIDNEGRIDGSEYLDSVWLYWQTPEEKARRAEAARSSAVDRLVQDFYAKHVGQELLIRPIVDSLRSFKPEGWAQEGTVVFKVVQ